MIGSAPDFDCPIDRGVGAPWRRKVQSACELLLDGGFSRVRASRIINKLAKKSRCMK
jgi:hypothetical protein